MFMKFLALLPLAGATTNVPSGKMKPTVSDNGQKSIAGEKSVSGGNSRSISEHAADTAAVVSADGSITMGSSRVIAAPNTTFNKAAVTAHEQVSDATAACLDAANRPSFDGMDIRSYEQIKNVLHPDRNVSMDQNDDFVCTKDMLPKKLHIVWLNSRMPEKYVRQANENALRNANWTMYVWVEERSISSIDFFFLFCSQSKFWDLKFSIHIKFCFR